MNINTKKVFSRLGFALSAAMLASTIIQTLMIGISSAFAPNFLKSGWALFIALGLGFYLIGFPIFLLITKNLPNCEQKESKKLSVKEILVLFLISYFFMAVTNIFTMLFINGFSLIKGGKVINPLDNLISTSNVLGTLLFAGILSPIIEELLFRKIMLNKLKIYGDKIAIITTAVCFGLFHANFSQFFYATALGLLWAYIALKTDTIKYTIILHITINIIGGVISPLAISNDVSKIIYSVLSFCFIISGLILFIINRKKVNILPGEVVIEKGQVFKTTCLNAGMIVYFLFMLINMIVILLA